MSLGTSKALGEAFGEVGVGEHAEDARNRLGSSHLDPGDSRVREVGSNEGGMGGGRFEVARVAAASGEQPAVLAPRDPFAEQAGRHGAPRMRSAASSTASTMFW